MVNRPTRLQDALTLLNQKTFTIMAGGTDLMVQNRGWSSTLPDFSNPTLFVKGLEKELKYIKKEAGYIKIGALATLEMCLKSKFIPSVYKNALKEMASVNIRNEATVAGNIENASPAGDSIPVLCALDAEIVLMSIDNERVIPINDYIIGVRKTVRMSNEMITEIRFREPTYTHHQWIKVGGRRADAISKVCFVGLAELENDTVKDIRLSLGAVSPVAIRDKALEAQFCGPLAELKENIDDVIEAYDPLIQPINDQRSNKDYRRQVSHNMIRGFIESLC
jgi:CO/xanthine dehydrogenase FAD-binding subunit